MRKGHVSGVSHGQGGICSDVNKDWTCKDKDQAYKDRHGLDLQGQGQDLQGQGLTLPVN